MVLKGVNLGGWLLMEGYILGGRNIPQQAFKDRFRKIYGQKELDIFEKEFTKNFVTEKDLRLISSWGANCIRLPFHYKLLEKSPYKYDKQSLFLIKKVLRWAERYGLKVILDLHAACGSQNEDWHSDSRGRALLWESESFRERTYALWRYLADNLKDEAALHGFDVLNEPVLPRKKTSLLKQFYKKVIAAIRESDKKKIVFLEGSNWAQDIDFLKDIISDNTAVSIHTYQPLNFTFNFRKNYTYPGCIDQTRWNKNCIRRYLEKYNRFSQRYNVDIFVGEFGVNYRGNKFGELLWLNDILSIFREYRFSWTYWTYKAVANSAFPDGVVQYLDNPPWIRREGPVYGLENLYSEWESNKRKIIDSWGTDDFWVNTDIVNILKRYFRS